MNISKFTHHFYGSRTTCFAFVLAVLSFGGLCPFANGQEDSDPIQLVVVDVVTCVASDVEISASTTCETGLYEIDVNGNPMPGVYLSSPYVDYADPLNYGTGPDGWEPGANFVTAYDNCDNVSERDFIVQASGQTMIACIIDEPANYTGTTIGFLDLLYLGGTYYDSVSWSWTAQVGYPFSGNCSVDISGYGTCEDGEFGEDVPGFQEYPSADGTSIMIGYIVPSADVSSYASPTMAQQIVSYSADPWQNCVGLHFDLPDWDDGDNFPTVSSHNDTINYPLLPVDSCD